MADGDVYVNFTGIVTWIDDPREVNGRTFRNVSIETCGSGQKVQLNLYDNYPEVEIEKANLVFGRGKYKSKPGQDREGNKVTYHSVDVYNLGVQGFVPREDTRGQGGAAPAQAAPGAPPPF
jgi:hypothetical protein